MNPTTKDSVRSPAHRVVLEQGLLSMMNEQENPPHPDQPSEEPQNDLTRKFTEEEWTALKAFRLLTVSELESTLPDLFAEAFPDKPDVRTTPINLWGILIHPTDFGDARASVVLMKFLRASGSTSLRNLDTTGAKDMLIKTLRWRDSFKPEETFNEDFPVEIFGNLGHVSGVDNEGRPVTYNLYGANQDLKAIFGDIPRFLRWRVSLMERGIQKLNFETTDQMLQVHDYEGVSLSSRDANSKKAANDATEIFTNYYPEFLWFVNVPTIMAWIFWAFKPFLPTSTAAKMSVVGHGSDVIGKDLLPYIPKDQLPERYGGAAEAF
ncbi:hypothetical protein Clacol_005383 [Clathrus columnatus]|uniref:Phosphatidylinositol transfer protein SFH5 n=1 Tax=Clathrus columnatus TaxID=1419009 RepID=A0AAV5ABT5_9AGAM|nr:hypothetical protein Clacol_005383 [Clathrus columnatus]